RIECQAPRHPRRTRTRTRARDLATATQAGEYQGGSCQRCTTDRSGRGTEALHHVMEGGARAAAADTPRPRSHRVHRRPKLRLQQAEDKGTRSISIVTRITRSATARIVARRRWRETLLTL